MNAENIIFTRLNSSYADSLSTQRVPGDKQHKSFDNHQKEYKAKQEAENKMIEDYCRWEEHLKEISENNEPN